MPFPILAPALSAFAIGTTEFVMMGILPELAHSLSVSIPSAGLLPMTVLGFGGVFVMSPTSHRSLSRSAALLRMR